MWLIFTLLHIFSKVASDYHTMIFFFSLSNVAFIDTYFVAKYVHVMDLEIKNVKFCGLDSSEYYIH